MHLFSGRILNIDTPIVAVLGTDSAIGKRTTSVLLEDALLKGALMSLLLRRDKRD